MRLLACFLILLAIQDSAAAEEPLVGGIRASVWAERLRTEDWPEIERTRDALAGFGDAAVPVLRYLAKRPDAPRDEIARILARIRPKEGLAIFLERLREGPEYPRFFLKWIGQLGPDAASAVEPVAKWLDHEDWETREAAANALGRIGRAAVPALVRALEHENHDARKAAARALGRIEPPVRQAIEPLAAVLDDPKVYTSGAAAIALSWIEPATPGVARALLELDRASTAWGYEALRAVRDHRTAMAPDLVSVLFAADEGLRDEAVAHLFVPDAVDLALHKAEARRWLTSEDEERAALAACLLARAGSYAPDVLEVLTRSFRSGRKEIRIQALRAVGTLRTPGRATITALMPLLHDTDPDIASAAAHALTSVGVDPEEIVPVLMRGLRGELPGLRRQDAGSALAKCGGAAAQAIPLLVEALGEDTTWWMGRHRRKKFVVKGTVWPAGVLGEFGAAALPTVPALLAATTWDHGNAPPEMEWAVEKAIAAIGPRALPALAEALETDAFPTAAAILAEFGPLASLVAKKIRPHVPKDGKRPWTIVLALARAEPERAESVRPLENALAKGLWHPWNCGVALGMLGPVDHGLLPLLRRLLDTEDVEERYQIALAIDRAGGGPAAAVDALIACLDKGICPRPADEILAKAGKRKGEVVARLIAGYEERELRDFVYALEGAGAAGKIAIPHLEKIRRHLPKWSENYDRDLRLILRSIREP